MLIFGRVSRAAFSLRMQPSDDGAGLVGAALRSQPPSHDLIALIPSAKGAVYGQTPRSTYFMGLELCITGQNAMRQIASAHVIAKG